MCFDFSIQNMASSHKHSRARSAMLKGKNL